MSLCVSLLAALALASAKPAKAPVNPAGDSARLVRRTLTIDAAAAADVPAIRVAPGITTTLSFPTAVPASGVVLVDTHRLFLAPQTSGRNLFLTPTAKPGSVVTTLAVTLEDGSPLPFQLVGASPEGQVDLQVDVVMASGGREAQEGSAAASCARSTAQLRGALDECRATTGAAGLRKIAELILAQDLGKAPAFVVERRSINKIDKQNRLYVQVQSVYRLFDYSYLVLTVENRDPGRTWILDRATVRLSGAGADLPVVEVDPELAALEPTETEKVVVVFATAPKRSSSAITLVLTEKGGTRHVTLEGLDL